MGPQELVKVNDNRRVPICVFGIRSKPANSRFSKAICITNFLYHQKSNDSTELGCCNSFFSSKFVMMENFPCRITDAIEFESLFFML